MNQNILLNNAVENITALIKENTFKKIFLVCGPSFEFMPFAHYFASLRIPFFKFNGFTPNPLYEDVVKGVELFRFENCDAIMAVGGGSTIDVAKCIKLFCKMDSDENFLKQEYTDSGVPLIAVPTTAGTGSESTRYAVIYFKGKKQSVTHDSIIPNYVILDSTVLKTLSLYQKKCSMLDALCQGIESWWSINSTKESKEYSKKAVTTIIDNYCEYLKGSEEAAKRILLAANYAGRAINITQTTAAHAMSYKLTSMYRLPHGHAVALCLPPVWKYMDEHFELCIDERGEAYLQKVFEDISNALGCSNTAEAISRFVELLKELNIQDADGENGDIEILAESVNSTRLRNNPVLLNKSVLIKLYSTIVRIKQ